jgi:site-specific recombinase XerD
MTREGTLQMVRRWGRCAGFSRSRLSPHTFRHTFAVTFLRLGGDVFTLKAILGHESLTMVNRYVALAQADVMRKHAQFSPLGNLRGRR